MLSSSSSSEQQQQRPQLPQRQSSQPHHPFFRRSWGQKENKDRASASNKGRQERARHENSSRKIHFLDALAFVHVSPNLLQSPGMPVLRVEANGRTIPSFLRLSDDKFTVTLSSEEKIHPSLRVFYACRSSSADVRNVDIGEMDRVQRGQSTQQFERAAKTTKKRTSVTLRKVDLSRQTSQNSMHSNTSGCGGGGGGSVKNGMSRSMPASTTANGGSTTTNKTSVAAATALSTGTAPSPVVLTTTTSPTVLDPKRSFSIIFRGAHTLDMMAMTAQERDEICDSLDRILGSYQRAKVRVADDVRLLRHVWIDVAPKTGSSEKSSSSNNIISASSHSKGESPNGSSRDVVLLNERQVAKVFLQINFSMKPRDLSNAYEKFGKVIGLDRSARRKGLTFEQLADFLHYVRRNQWMVKPVTVIWNGLFGELMKNHKPRETVSDKTFAEKFLYATQHQHRMSMTDVRKLFRLLHDMEISHRGRSDADGGDHGLIATTDLNRINKNQFEAYLLSPSHNEAFDPEKERHRVSDMDRPLSEYWINSSHNTYLIGDQYTSQSSVEMYSNALYRGCRCLELDIWDGPAGSIDPVTGKQQLTPVVWHGHTMTTKIFFTDIIQCVKVFLNFHPTEYPIILSFENHCSIPYQQVIAEQLIRILGHSLYIPSEVSLNGHGAKLPSPLQLRGMVVIKGRRPNKKSSIQSSTISTINNKNDKDHSHTEVECSYEEGGDITDEESEDGDGPGEGGVDVTHNSATSTTCNTADLNAEVVKEVPPAPTSQKSTKTNSSNKSASTAAAAATIEHDVAPELARLTLFHGHKYKNWDASIASPTHYMHSFSENQIRAKINARYRPPPSRSSKQASQSSTTASSVSTGALSSKKLFSIHNQTHMTRTYPAGSRVDSSNYNPLLAWSVGCQMAAMNYQTPDAFLRLNDGRFRENGNCGYVLKPSPLMMHKLFDESAQQQQDFRENVPVKMTIRVLSGSCLPKPKGLRTGESINPYVRVACFDVSNGTDGEIRETVTKYLTGVVKSNGFNPIWHDGKFTFMVNDWAVAMLQLTVYDESRKAPDDFIASASIPISCLRRGFRSVKLYDANNTRSAAFDFCSLLLEIKIGQGGVAEI